MPTDQELENENFSPVSSAILRHRDEIIHVWERRLRGEVKGAAELKSPILVDTLPKFIDNLAEALSPGHHRWLASDSTTLAFDHGGERARLSNFGPDQLVLEYQILREELLRLVGHDVTVSVQEIDVIQKSIDKGIQEAMATFFLVHTQLKEQFVAAVTHDLRNPLSAAKISAELLLLSIKKVEDATLRDSLRRLAEKTLNNTKRADRLIQNLLDTHLLQVGEKMSLHLAPCAIQDVVREVITELPTHEQARVKVDGPDAQGLWDAEALRRSLENLLSNAIKYGDSETPIQVKVEPAFGRLQLSVNNRGDPIPLKEYKTLLEPYRRGEQAKKKGVKGWGIGLSLIKGVAEAHGGSLLLDSSRERGTTFTLDIPEDPRAAARAV